MLSKLIVTGAGGLIRVAPYSSWRRCFRGRSCSSFKLSQMQDSLLLRSHFVFVIFWLTFEKVSYSLIQLSMFFWKFALQKHTRMKYSSNHLISGLANCEIKNSHSPPPLPMLQGASLSGIMLELIWTCSGSAQSEFPTPTPFHHQESSS